MTHRHSTNLAPRLAATLLAAALLATGAVSAARTAGVSDLWTPVAAERSAAEPGGGGGP